MALSYACGTAATPLLGETIGDNLDATVAAHGDRDALVVAHQGIRWTYAELGAQVDRVARALIAAGIEHGDRVALWAPNCAEWVLIQYATAKVGAIMVCINPAYRPGELAYALNQSGARLLVAATSFKGSDYVAMLDEVRDGCTTLERAVFLGTDSWDALLAGAQDVAPAAVAERQARTTFDEPINIQYTSGTTGNPKGATLSHHNLLNNGAACAAVLGYTEADRVCIPVPYYHCFGMVIGNLACTSHGACMVSPAPAFDPAATLAAVAAERCTSLYGVPTMFIAMLEDPTFAEHDLSSLRTGVMAGSPCPVEVMRRVIDRMGMAEVAIMFGMTETSPVQTATARDDALELKVGTVGRALPHVEVKVVDPGTGQVLPRGEAGEVCARGYNVMLGYWDDPERTAQAIDAARWMHTGDLGTMDEDGYVRITGRIKDLIIRGGENISPRELEELLFEHPDVADAQVVGIPDERFGEEVVACVIPRGGAAPDPDELRAWCKGRIAHFKVPRHVVLVDAFPMTVTGKIQKFVLRQAVQERLQAPVGG